jgi:Fe-S-cluster containining protein
MGNPSCSRCGKCCISLGKHMSLAASLSSRSHYLKVGVTGEVIPVTIPPDYLTLFVKKDPEHFDPSWCPFLRRTEDGSFYCTIYPERPGICRQFACFTMAITDPSGKLVGRVVGRRTLESKDPALIRVWNGQVKEIPDVDQAVWLGKVEKILKNAGFGVVAWQD